MSDNWVVQNLENALETWNEKLSEIWTLITTTPQNFKGVILSILVYTFFSRMFDLMLPPVAKHSIVVA